MRRSHFTVLAVVLASGLCAHAQSSFSNLSKEHDPTAPTGRAADVGVGENVRIDPVANSIPPVNPAQLPVGVGGSAPGTGNESEETSRRKAQNLPDAKVMCFVAGQGYVVVDASSCASHESAHRVSKQPAKQDQEKTRRTNFAHVEKPLPTSPEEQRDSAEMNRLAGATAWSDQRAQKMQALQQSGVTPGVGVNADSAAALANGNTGREVSGHSEMMIPRTKTAKAGDKTDQHEYLRPSITRAANNSNQESARTPGAGASHRRTNAESYQEAQTRYERCQQLAKKKDKTSKDARLYERTCNNF